MAVPNYLVVGLKRDDLPHIISFMLSCSCKCYRSFSDRYDVNHQLVVGVDTHSLFRDLCCVRFWFLC